MKTFKLEGAPRTELGKKSVKAYRKEGLIPAVLYGGSAVELPYKGKLAKGENLVESQGKGLIVTNFTVSFDAVRKLIYTPEIFIVELSLGGKEQQAILKDLQFHPVSDQILHLDFLEVFDEKPIVIEVPVALDGHAAGVKAGGKLNLVARKLRVKGLAANIPNVLRVNVENLELGKTIQVKELSFDNIELVNAPDNVVCAVVATRGSRAAAEAEKK
ncbi:MAG: 50S ribosomal protein L25/general stress protein Ctc [Prevotellaceae bacterium]|jgi:large subunit ribosomal protein L25|nr:50S ribosomal protein L25/general stress protein Ctc [Prevotellaceae bacterium]